MKKYDPDANTIFGREAKKEAAVKVAMKQEAVRLEAVVNNMHRLKALRESQAKPK